MTTIIAPQRARADRTAGADRAYRQPRYESALAGEQLRLTLYVPGVGAQGVEIEARRGDLVVTAEKARYVRVNWHALQLEPAQRDYRLRLRLGAGYDFASMHAEIHDGVLTIVLPRRAPAVAGAPRRRGA